MGPASVTVYIHELQKCSYARSLCPKIKSLSFIKLCLSKKALLMKINLITAETFRRFPLVAIFKLCPRAPSHIHSRKFSCYLSWSRYKFLSTQSTYLRHGFIFVHYCCLCISRRCIFTDKAPIFFGFRILLKFCAYRVRHTA